MGTKSCLTRLKIHSTGQKSCLVLKGKSFKVAPLDTKFRAEKKKQVRPQNCMFQEASPRAIEWIITLASSTAFSQKLADHKS